MKQNITASEMGKIGGSRKSPAKTKAARENARKPRKKETHKLMEADHKTPELVMLLPCPLCGGEAEIERKGSHRAYMMVTCTNCGCSVESGDVYGLTTPERMAWNRRSKISQHNTQAQARPALPDAECSKQPTTEP